MDLQNLINSFKEGYSFIAVVKTLEELLGIYLNMHNGIKQISIPIQDSTLYLDKKYTFS